ncbi:MAG: protein-glutamate O-methyltransferase CheR [bacterium]|nr:protein-glutamate O-methyltransferase CheR [bacterium]
MLGKTEIETLLTDLQQIYGEDFRYYSRDSFERRVNRFVKLENFKDYSALLTKLRSDKHYIQHFIDHITVNVTEMFRDTAFFNTLNRQLIPQLTQHSTIRIWHAGCSTGEEVYSTAILFQEAGLLEKCVILATDINSRVLERADSGLFYSSLMPLYEAKYRLAGGEKNFSSYFTKTTEGEKISENIRSQISFQNHNLASGNYLGKFDLIICRNVLIYFDRIMREMVFRLFDDSTGPNSFIALGERETLDLSSISKHYTKLESEMIWKKTN